jgi:hypothetical protein
VGATSGASRWDRPPAGAAHSFRAPARPHTGRASPGANTSAVYLVRVTRAAFRELHTVMTAATPTHARLRDTLMALAVATVAIDVICAILALLLERHVATTQIHTFGSALFWTSAQLLTVSSQLPNPLSFGGRVLDVAMEAYAITVVATLAGSIGAFLVRRAREADEVASVK